ncbi:MAG: glycerophosphodiester phosphodiesterase family protein [Hyphomicrobium sp.]
MKVLKSALFFSLLALLLMPYMPAQQPERILVHAHRGGRALRPENTIAAFEYAISTGADVLELDLGVTKDNVVVSHDSVLNPPICTGPKPNAAIRSLTLSELKQWDCGSTRNPQFERQQTVPGQRVPTLDEVFALRRAASSNSTSKRRSIRGSRS